MARAPRSKTSAKSESEAVASEHMIIPPAPAPVQPAPVDHEHSPPPVGEQLRRERERRGISIEAVAQMLKIRRVYLIAIEQSNWAELPEPVYVSGFIRSYANFLGLNVQHPIPAAKTEIINLPSLPKLEIPKPIDDQQLPSVTTIIFAALGLFFLYAVWVAVHSDTDKTTAQTTTPAAPTEQTTSDAAPSSPTPTLLNEPALVQSDDVAPKPAASASAPTPEPAPAAEIKPAVPPATVYGATTSTRATITATQDSWIQIQTPDKHVVFTGVLRAGDSYRVPADNVLSLSTTNLSGLKFELDGKPAAPSSGTQNNLDQALSLAPDHFLKPNAPAPDAAAEEPKPPAPTLSSALKTHTAVAPKSSTKAPAHYMPPETDAEDSTSDYNDDNQ